MGRLQGPRAGADGGLAGGGGVKKTERVEKIKGLFLAGFEEEDNLPTKETLSDLHVVIRVLVDLQEFLNDEARLDDPETVDYIVGTLRSGMDFFFSVKFAFQRSSTGWTDNSLFPSSMEWKENHLALFEQLEVEEMPIENRLGLLLSLVSQAIQFMGFYFYIPQSPLS
jgi:hypothetical protein